ncbi:NAD(P)-dependent oxidoreductase [Aquisalibacillus elongatus]|uniref:3-hydroxyisobutyrate dehydrogenase n=1 Tax=Aquisalibacillus elongatus TaxID=485577 RepID=A0A3N5B534_9BACI|nr:NAD(P)-dependent oxidoreductase [Aquisalibacillus elongatus]RPF52219.1 3-hydroxyisobutyrate dehydrogenase [Aquisalibacillus elongatus]
MKNIGVIGCGLMGGGIAKTLLREGFNVTVFDINKNNTNLLAEMGAIEAKNVQEIGLKSEAVILSLPSPEIIKETVTEILKTLPKGHMILDMSTNDVEMTRQLHTTCLEKDIIFFDCPLSGGPQGAENGELIIFCGGDENHYTRLRPLFDSIGEYDEYVGPSGSGQIIKLCHNMLVAGIIHLLSETLMTGEQAGVSMEKLANIFQKGTGHTRVMNVFGPNILNQTFDQVKFSLNHMTKDLSLYMNLADNVHSPTMMSQKIHQIYRDAQSNGKGEMDSTAIYQWLKSL